MVKLKKKMGFLTKTIIFLLMVITVSTNWFKKPVTVKAEEISGDYTYEISHGNATIVGYNGSDTYLNIPDSLDGYPVTAIGQRAFWRCTSLTGVTLPDGCQQIKEYAFYGCTNLKEIPSSASLTTIEDYAFSGCTQITELTLKEGITDIGNWAFEGCQISYVKIPSSIVRMGGGFSPFSGCPNLETVEFEDGTTEIPFYALAQIKSLKEVILPETVTTLNEGAFQDDENLLTVNLPSGITTIPKHAFWRCTSLTGVTLPDGCQQIKEYAFYGCTNLKEIPSSASLTTIEDYAFSGCTQITELTLKEGITDIGNWAFEGCQISYVKIPSSIVRMGGGFSPFSGCPNLETVEFEDGTTEIPFYALAQIKSLKEVILPETVTTLNEGAFQDDENLLTVNLPSGITTISEHAFWRCTSLTGVTLPDGCLKIEDGAFYGCTNLKMVQIPRSVTSISSNAFFEDNNLTIYGYSGSYVQTYAADHNIPFIVLSEGSITTITKSAAAPVKHYYGVNYYSNTACGDIYDDAKEFTKAMDNYLAELGKAVQKDANAAKKQKKSSAEILKAKDASTNNKFITMQANTPDAVLNSVYAALAQYLEMYVQEGISLGKIDMSASTIDISVNIVKEIQKNLNCNYFTRRINNYTVSFNILSFGIGGGTISVSGNGRSYSGYILTNTQKNNSKILAEYINALSVWEKDALYETLHSIFSDLSEVTGISDFTKSEIKSLLKDKVETLQSKGYGNQLKYCNKVRDGYDIVHDIISAKDADSLSSVMDHAESIYKKLTKLDYSDESVTNKTVSLAMNRLQNTMNQLERDFYDYLYSGKTEGNENWITKKWNSFRSLFIQCPVDLTIYDKTGTILGQITDTDYTYSEDIYISVDNDVKTVIIPDGIEVNLEFNGSDVGTMTYVIEQTKNGEVTGRANYYDITLEKGKEFSQELSNEDISSEFQGEIHSDDLVITPSEYLDVSDETACVTIDSTNNEGGLVLGTGTYVKGDPVTLTAIPDEGYHFKGWYLDKQLVELSTNYRFSALDSVSVYACFEKDRERENISNIEMSELYVGTMDFSVYKNADQTNDILIFTGQDSDLQSLNVQLKKFKKSTSEAEITSYETVFDGVNTFSVSSVDIQDVNHIEIYTADGSDLIGTIYYSETDTPTPEEHDFSDQPYFTDDAGKHYQKCKDCGAESEHVACTPGDPVTENVVPFTCDKNGSHDEVVYCTICKQKLSVTSKVDVAPGKHDFGSPVYQWSKDNTTITAKRICARDSSHVEKETVTTVKTIKQPTCTSDGQITYKAVFKNSAFSEQIKTVNGQSALGHHFQNGTCTRCHMRLSGKWMKSGTKWWYRYSNGSYPSNSLCKIDNKWYYFDTAGWMQTGWQKISNSWYYFDADGKMTTGWQYVNKQWYYLNSNGKMATGWKQLNKYWYYFESSGKMATGWQYLNKHWYFLNSNGKMATGWKNANNHWYYLDTDGKMAIGWQKMDSLWYYFETDGSMIGKGWHLINSKWYYMYESGAMAANTWIGKYYVDANGVWKK